MVLVFTWLSSFAHTLCFFPAAVQVAGVMISQSPQLWSIGAMALVSTWLSLLVHTRCSSPAVVQVGERVTLQSPQVCTWDCSDELLSELLELLCSDELLSGVDMELCEEFEVKPLFIPQETSPMLAVKAVRVVMRPIANFLMDFKVVSPYI